MSTLDVVAEVLREVAPRALKARQIAVLAGNRLPTASRTPETVISRDLAIDVRDRGAASRFLRVDRGAFVLKEALPTAFYNDNDSYAAQWTRNLIAAGEIAAGVVDERSIRDLKPADVASYRQCHFFSGIGVWSRALRDGGWPDDANVWSGSCPCQPLSQAGRRRGFADERHLWPEWFRLIADCRPTVLVGEQVSSKDGLAWLDLVFADLEGADYSVRAIDIPTASVGGPHARQRLYFVAYARERGREIVGAPWLHDRGQRWDDAARRGTALDRDAGSVSDAAGARPCMPQDAGADRGDACEGTEAIQWRSAGHLEPERSGASDEAGAVPDAECIVRDAGGPRLAHGWTEVESDRHGEADGARIDGDGTVGLGDTGLARGGRDPGAFPRTQGAGEGEWIEARDLTDEPVTSSSDDEHGFRPGDRIRIGDDPGWGGAVRGYWAQSVEWIYCRPEPGHQDGRWRPAESGTQPLLDGFAPEMGRTRSARLRGYGNAIVLPLATTFVEAVIDTFADAARSLDLSAVDAAAVPAIFPEPVDARMEESAA
jgi:DNA (cytosine-5)-methyltransferase 1